MSRGDFRLAELAVEQTGLRCFTCFRWSEEPARLLLRSRLSDAAMPFRLARCSRLDGPRLAYLRTANRGDPE